MDKQRTNSAADSGTSVVSSQCVASAARQGCAGKGLLMSNHSEFCASVRMKTEDDDNTISFWVGELHVGSVTFDEEKSPPWCVAIEGVSDGWSLASRFHTRELGVAYALSKLGVVTA